MSEIDVQNAKQIRDPMDVLITMDVPDEEITLTYSGYSSAKVADGVLNQQSWPMRLLADLKSDGFPLDGSRVLYNSSTQASSANGKIGVRSNVGEAVSVTVTGNKTLASLSLFVTGAKSVTYNGTTSAIVGGQAIIPVGARSITLTFNPAITTDRIEISDIIAGTSLRITNDSIIRCVVSLRSNLSPFDQTLPESELNVEVYNDADISEVVASLPEDTPITYQAGYPGDMSPLRKFYVSGQVTWADNVLSIHAVDAVHFLDITPGIAWWLKEPGAASYVASILLRVAGVDLTEDLPRWIWDDEPGRLVIPAGITIRETVARAMWAFRVRGAIGSSYKGGPVWLTYVDAGRPSLKLVERLPRAGRRINEEDCASIKTNVEKKHNSIRAESKRFLHFKSNGTSPNRAGTGTWIKNLGVTLSIDKLLYDFAYGIDAGDNFDSQAALKVADYYRMADSVWSAMTAGPTNIFGSRNYQGYSLYGAQVLFTSEASQEVYNRIADELDYNDYARAYVGFVPWSARITGGAMVGNREVKSMSAAWKAYVDAGAFQAESQSQDLVVCGNGFDPYDFTFTISNGQGGDHVAIEDLFWGNLISSSEGTIYPNGVYLSRLEDSPITCSFTWKGDPRIQPRDVFTFHRLDGTDEEWTFENITITHEGGGTLAEVTARKGIV